MTTSYVIDVVRTPRGRGKPGKGALSGIHPQELLAQLLVALGRRNGFDATAGNSSGIADGAGAVLIASERYVRETGARPRARIRSMATLGSEPVIMLTAPAPVSEKALRLAGMSPRDIDLWEINEAFAAVVLQTMRKLDLDPDRVNVNGGAIALGHPLGATGAMLLGTALDELERLDKQTALIAMCTAGGQGIATILERLS